MSQFRSVGGLDEPISEDVDRGFFSVNQRLQLNQLQEGEVRESLNGRMEGYWKPRKGVVEKTTALTTGQTPLQLPFYLIGTAENYLLTEGSENLIFENSQVSTLEEEIIISNSKPITDVTVPSTGLVYITVTDHGCEAGSSGWATISGLDALFNGSYVLTYVDANTLSYALAGVATPPVDKVGLLSQMIINDAANANVRASCLFSDPNTSNKEFIIVAMDTVAKKIDLAAIEAGLGAAAITDIPYPSGQALGVDGEMIQLFDKVILFRDGQQALEWFPNGRPVLAASSDATPSPNTVVTMSVRDHGLLVGTSILIAGLTVGTSPNGTYTVASVPTQDTFTFIASGISLSTVFGVTAATATDGFTLSPAGTYTQPQVFSAQGSAVESSSGLVTLTVENNVTLKQNDIIVIYQSSIPELDFIVGKEYQLTFASATQLQFYAPAPDIIVRDLASASVSGSIVKLFTATDHGLPIGSKINVNDLEYLSGTNPNGLHATVRQATNINSATQLSNVVTVNISSHGFTTGNLITVDGIDFVSGTNPNGIFMVTVLNANEFTYPLVGASGTYITTNAFATQDDLTKRLLYNLVGASGTYSASVAYITTATGGLDQQLDFGGRFSVGGGFMHQPAAPWGVSFQRRLWVPYYYDQSGAFNAPIYTSRKITDEIAVSDILDTTTFDQIENQFRISGGTADYVVGMHGFYDDALVVLNRNSLHIVKGTLGSLLDCTVKELTSEIGCLARKSVVMRGNTMMFLSDDGVYSLEFLNDYNLRGSEEPISKNIQPYIDRINKTFAAEAVGILFDNRYYLAVALDSVVGANDAQGNNSVLVYNFKNQGWESLDTYGDARFLIKNLITGGAGVRNELYAVTRNGGLHQIDAVESSIDRLNVSNVGGSLVTTAINSSLTTRGYDLKTMERKRFTDAQVTMQNLAGDTGEYMISFAAEDPDNASEIGSTTKFLGGTVLAPTTPNEAETASIRCRLAGIRGYTGTLILTRTIGSPKINSVKVAGSVTNRQIISQK